MDFLELAKTRQSTRRFNTELIDRDIIEKCLEAARLAPSACNSQPWHFVVLDEPKLKDQVAQCTFSKAINFNHFTMQAPVMVVIVSERQAFSAKIGNLVMKKRFTLFDIGIAAEHFCLAAAEQGISTCILGWFDQKKIARILKVSKTRKVELLISVGKPASGRIRGKIRKTIDEIRTYNKY